MKILSAQKIFLSALLAIALVTFLFADVIFHHATFQPSNIVPLIGKPGGWKIHAFIPQVNNRTAPGYGYADLGATAWQGEPARYLMTRDFQEHESPYWNPYSASGTVGPETLVDIKFSPWTVISAYFFHASSLSFDGGLLIIFTLGVFCVLIVLRHYLQLSWLAATAGALVFLLNGYAVPNLNAQMGQPYFFAPPLLLALFCFSNRPTVMQWSVLVLADAMMLSITFLPTLLLVLMTTHAFALAWFCSSQSSKNKLFSPRKILKYTLVHAGWMIAAGLIALLLAGFLWLPILDSFFVTDMLTKYQARTIQTPHQLESLLSVFTPKHFWQSCSEMLHARLYPQAHLEQDETLIAYTGIVPIMLACFAIPKSTRSLPAITIIAILLLVFSYARVFGFLGIIDHLPIATNIGWQYYGCISGLALVVLVACGINNILQENFTILPACFTLTIIACAFIFLWHRLGFIDFAPYDYYLKILLLLLAASILFITILAKKLYSPTLVVLAVLGLMTFELFFYMNTVRPQRYDAIDKAPAFVSFLKANIGDGRVMNIGLTRSLYPEYGAQYGIRQIDTQNPGQMPWYRDFYVRHFGSSSWLFLFLGWDAEKGQHIPRANDSMDHALDIANVKYILVANSAKAYQDYFQQHHYPIVFNQDKLTIFENTHRLTTATLVPALLSLDVIPETDDFNPSLQASTKDATLLTEARLLGIPVLDHPDSHLTTPSGTAKVVTCHNTEILIDTESTQAAILALSEVWHPGWKATVDERPVNIDRINEAFRGIALPAGKHRVRVFYDPASVRYGWWLSIVTALVLLLLMIYSSFRSL